MKKKSNNLNIGKTGRERNHAVWVVETTRFKNIWYEVLCAGLRRSQTGTEATNAIKILLQWATWNEIAEGRSLQWCLKHRTKGVVVEEGRKKPKTSGPEAKKGKAGAKKRRQERRSSVWRPPDQKTSPSGKSATLKFCSWNVDGLQTWIRRNV